MAIPASASPPPAGELPGDMDLDTRISLVEQRLDARQKRLFDRVEHLGRRVGQAAAPRALALKVAGVALAGAGLLWTLRRSGGSASGRSEHRPSGQDGSASALLLGFLPLAWPLLPERLRSRISPATAATVLGLAAPVLERLFARRNSVGDDSTTPPPPVATLDLARYAGTWHEQARLPEPFERACAGQPCATYTLVGPRLAVRNKCPTAHGRIRVAEGMARVVPRSGGARLQVSFVPVWLQWLPWVWADLWVLHVDEAAADYRVAIAGHPSRQRLWLLSRCASLPADELQRLVARAGQLGYDTSRLVMAAQPGASG